MFERIKQLFVKTKRYGNAFENEEVQQKARERAEEIRRLNFEEREALHKLKVLRAKEKLQEYKDEINSYLEDDEESSSNVDNMLMGLIAQVIAGNKPSVSVSPQIDSFSSQQTPLNLSDEEILNQINGMPKHYLKLAKNMPVDTINAFLKQNFPAYSDDTINRTIALLKT